MNIDDIKRKLTSRKFWAAIAAFVSMLMVTMGESQEVATKVTALIMAGAAVVAYIVGEGLIDAASSGTTTFIELEPPDKNTETDNDTDIDIPAE